MVTGAFGFVGRSITRELNNKYQFLNLDIGEQTGNGIQKFYSWDELDLIDWDSIDTVIHLAGIAHDTKCKIKEQEYFDVNVGLTKKIFDYFSRSKARKFLYFSSVKAVADKVEVRMLTEEDSPHPKTPYGRSKLAAEQILIQSGIWNPIEPSQKHIYILRPCLIYGPGNKGNFNSLIKFVNAGLPWPLGSYNNRRSFSYINNLVFIVNQLIEHDIATGIYQVADDQGFSTNDLVRIIAETLGQKIRILDLSPEIIRFISRIGDTFRLPINSEQLEKLTGSYLVSNKKIKNALGIDRMPFTANEGMKNTIYQYR